MKLDLQLQIDSLDKTMMNIGVNLSLKLLRKLNIYMIKNLRIGIIVKRKSHLSLKKMI